MLLVRSLWIVKVIVIANGLCLRLKLLLQPPVRLVACGLRANFYKKKNVGERAQDARYPHDFSCPHVRQTQWSRGEIDMQIKSAVNETYSWLYLQSAMSVRQTHLFGNIFSQFFRLETWSRTKNILYLFSVSFILHTFNGMDAIHKSSGHCYFRE
jgi:hypothetical protein